MYVYVLFGSTWKHVDYDDLFDVKGIGPPMRNCSKELTVIIRKSLGTLSISK